MPEPLPRLSLHEQLDELTRMMQELLHDIEPGPSHEYRLACLIGAVTTLAQLVEAEEVPLFPYRIEIVRPFDTPHWQCCIYTLKGPARGIVTYFGATLPQALSEAVHAWKQHQETQQALKDLTPRDSEEEE